MAGMDIWFILIIIFIIVIVIWFISWIDKTEKKEWKLKEKKEAKELEIKRQNEENRNIVFANQAKEIKEAKENSIMTFAKKSEYEIEWIFKKLKTYFGDDYDSIEENISYLKKVIFEQNEKELQNCGVRLRFILEIILSTFTTKINPDLFVDLSVDDKEKTNAYKIDKINDYYKPNQNIINSFHNIRKFSNSLIHYNNEKQDFTSLTDVLNDVQNVLCWIFDLHSALFDEYLTKDFPKEELRTFFGSEYNLIIKDFTYLAKIVYEKNYQAVKYCGLNLREILEITLSLFEIKINPSLFDDPLFDKRDQNTSSYKINKINDYYKPEEEIINSFHNIRIFSNSLLHYNNDENINLDSLSNILNDVQNVLFWISNIYLNLSKEI